ncbi:MAG: hypothetical protein MJ014_08220 [Methanocorpusculum sp.]|nr:hypothetical protein [Methanocorpusculum sp.]
MAGQYWNDDFSIPHRVTTPLYAASTADSGSPVLLDFSARNPAAKNNVVVWSAWDDATDRDTIKLAVPIIFQKLFFRGFLPRNRMTPPLKKDHIPPCPVPITADLFPVPDKPETAPLVQPDTCSIPPQIPDCSIQTPCCSDAAINARGRIVPAPFLVYSGAM